MEHVKIPHRDGSPSAPVATPARSGATPADGNQGKKKVKKTIVKVIKRQPKPKGTPAAPPTDPATTPGTEQQEAFDQYAQQCAAADSLKLKKLEEGAANVEDAPPQETMDAPASQNHAPQSCADTTVGAPLESEQNRAQSGEKAREETQSEPIGPPAPKVAAKAATTVKTEPTESYLDKTIRVLEKMGYTYEECANVLSGFDTNAQVDLWAVIDQINDARRTAAEMPLKPADNGTSSQEHEEGSEWNSLEKNTWESQSDWDQWGWKGWAGWGYYNRSSSWQSHDSDVVHSPSDKHIQAAMERADTQELDQGIPSNTSSADPGMKNKEAAETPESIKPKDQTGQETAPKENEGHDRADAPGCKVVSADDRDGLPETKDEKDENEKVPYKKTEAYKKAHAKYMKYYRSVHESPKTPPEIKKMARRAHGSSTLNGVLFEAWISCAGDWKKSKLYMSVTSSTTNQRLGRRRWMTASEMRHRFGDATDAIIMRKTADEELRAKEVRPHPECPLEESMVQYLCLDQELVCDQEEQQLSYLYQACDEDSSSSSASSGKAKKKSKKSRKSKKSKRKRSSSDSSGSCSSSEDDEKVAKKSEKKTRKTGDKHKKNKKKPKGKKTQKKSKKEKKDKEKENETPEEAAERAKKEQERKIAADAKKAINQALTKINSWKTIQINLDDVGERFKAAVTEDVEDKLKHVTSLRNELRQMIDENQVADVPLKIDQLKQASDDLDKAMLPAKKVKQPAKKAKTEES